MPGGDNFGTVVGENPTPYGILALWAVNGLSIVCWDEFDLNDRLIYRRGSSGYFPLPMILKCIHSEIQKITQLR